MKKIRPLPSLCYCGLLLLATAAAAQTGTTSGTSSGTGADAAAQPTNTANTKARLPFGADPATANGMVRGVVIDAETKRPVRLAQVQLIEQGSVKDGTHGLLMAGNSFGRTNLEGQFDLQHVAPGDYYVIAQAPGYVSERTLLQVQQAAGADLGSLLAALPQVHVGDGASGSAQVTLQRGGVLSGRAEWEDGSPAAGISLTAQVSQGSRPALAPRVPGFGPAPLFATTDDRGGFRIAGLAPGDYVLMLTVNPGEPDGAVARGIFASVRVYAPGVFRLRDAQVYNMGRGDERSDAHITIDLHGLHTITGSASSTQPDEAVASGRISLLDADTNTPVSFGTVQPDGSFTLVAIPAGNYRLQISGASSRAVARGSDSTTPIVNYKPFSQTVVVSDTDVTGLALSLTPGP
jgi:hypothetical protein